MRKRKYDFSTKITKWVGSQGSIVLHTIFFIGMFCLYFVGVPGDSILLILTTIVSLEAIYLAIFIQITVNRHSEELEEVSEDIEEIQKDVEEISEDVEEISEDMEGIEKDIGELQEDVEEINEEEVVDQESKFEYIEHTLTSLLKEIQELKKDKNK